MKEKEKKKTKKLKKATPSVKKAKARVKKSAPAKKKKLAPVKKSHGKEGIEKSRKGEGLAKEGVPSGFAGKVPYDEAPDTVLGELAADGLEGVIIHEDGTVSYTHHEGDAERPPGFQEYLVFRFAGSGYALKISDVHEILRHQRITRVPRSDAHVIGATSLRGAIIPVVNLAAMLSLADTAQPEKGRLLLLKGHGIILGLLVERGIGIKSLNPADIKPPLSVSGKDESLFMEGVFDLDGEFYSVLNPDAITGTKATGRLNETEA